MAGRDVLLLDRHWGTSPPARPPARTDGPLVAAACGYCAEALGLALLRSAAGADLEVRRCQLVDDLTERRWRAPGELVARARVLGRPFPADGRYAALVVPDLPVTDPDTVVRAVAPSTRWDQHPHGWSPAHGGQAGGLDRSTAGHGLHRRSPPVVTGWCLRRA